MTASFWRQWGSLICIQSIVKKYGASLVISEMIASETMIRIQKNHCLKPKKIWGKNRLYYK